MGIEKVELRRDPLMSSLPSDDIVPVAEAAHVGFQAALYGEPGLASFP